MRKITGVGPTSAAIRAKKQNEFELAGAIRKHFDDGELKIELNAMVEEACTVAEMMQGVKTTWDSNSWIGVYGRYKTIGKLKEAAERRAVSAEHCGDFIRVFGEIVESKTDNVLHHPELDKVKTSFQHGGDAFWDKRKSIMDHAKGTRDRLANKQILQNVSKTMQDRIRAYSLAAAGKGNENKKWVAKSNWGESGVRKKELKFPVFEVRQPSELSQIGGGMKKWSPQQQDILYRIEIAFGLRVGATISGTTADTLYFLSVFGKVNMDPIFYMLPFATIVAPGHHSLIEVAAPLTLNGHIDYKIGYYSTLFPLKKSRSKSAGAIRKTLLQYENNSSNKKMLVWYKKHLQIGGYWEMMGNEKGFFQRMGTANADLLTQFRGMPKSYLNELDLGLWVRNTKAGSPRAPIL